MALDEIETNLPNRRNEIDRRANEVKDFFLHLQKFMLATYKSGERGSPAPRFDETLQRYWETSTKDLSLSISCAQWKLSSEAMRKCDRHFATDLAAEQCFLALKSLRNAKAYSVAAFTCHTADLKRAKAGGEKRRDNMRPREAEAIRRINELLATNDMISNNDIASHLIGIASIDFRSRKLEKLAASVRKKVPQPPVA